MANQSDHVRFELAQRLEHALLVLSFSVLVVTGIPQKYAGTDLAEGIIALLGGIELVRTIHRISAIMFALEGAYHVIVVLYKILVRRIDMTMLPGVKDVIDVFDSVRFNLGLSKERPKMPRYNYAEKVEYWAMMWGAIIMGITGFMMWNPILTARLLPGEAIPAAKAAHGGEAILAALAILIWHFYNVHIKSLNKSMLNGRLSAHQMEEEHARELASADSQRPAPPRQVLRRRERAFFPIATVLFLTMAGGLFWFATFETTAIATVPRSSVPVFVPLTPTPVPPPTVEGRSAAIAAAIPHEITDREACDTCHAPGGLASIPADHVNRPNVSCLICHEPGEVTETTATASMINHPIAGREKCTLCHGDNTSLQPLPASHAGRTSESCTVCHALAEVGSLSEDRLPLGVPHPIEGAVYADCSGCHAAGKSMPLPASHGVFATEDCTTCHQPAPEGPGQPSATLPNPVPHSIEGPVYANCNTCHAAGAVKPAPDNHAAYAVDTCTTCHAPAAAGGAPATTTVTLAPATPHDLSTSVYTDCLLCHAAGTVKPAPANHVAYTVETCTTCHLESGS